MPPALSLSDPPASTDRVPALDALLAPASPARMAARASSPPRMLRMWNGNAATASDGLMVRLLGENEGRSLLVSAPERDGKFVFVKEGAEYSFRGFSGESVYEFTAAVIKVRFEPYPYMHVAWPQRWQVVRQPLRGARRVRTEIPCIVYGNGEGTGPFSKGVVSDLSVTGCRIALRDPIELAAPLVRVAFRLEVGELHVLVEAPGRPTRPPSEDGQTDPQLRVAFGALPEVQTLALHAYVSMLTARELEAALYTEAP